MKKFHNKSLALLVCVTLLLTCAVSGTVAYLVDASGPVENVFTPGSVVPEIDESNNSTAKQNVTIKNTGTVDAYIRAAIVITWQNGTNVLPADADDYALTLSDEWLLRDGYYYWPNKVGSNGRTGVLITECTSAVEPPADDYTLHVEILAQAIQAEPETVVENTWGVTVENSIIQ